MNNIKTKFKLGDKVFIRYQGNGDVLSGKIEEIDILSTKYETTIHYTVFTEEEFKSSHLHYVPEQFVRKNKQVPIH